MSFLVILWYIVILNSLTMHLFIIITCYTLCIFYTNEQLKFIFNIQLCKVYDNRGIVIKLNHYFFFKYLCPLQFAINIFWKFLFFRIFFLICRLTTGSNINKKFSFPLWLKRNVFNLNPQLSLDVSPGLQ